MAALKKYTVLAIDMHGDVVTSSNADTAKYARTLARDWLGFSNVGSVRVWRNTRPNVELFEVYVNNGGKCSVIKDGKVRNIRI